MQNYTLKYPFEFDGKTVNEVAVRRAKGRDLVAIEKHSRSDDASPFFAHAQLCDRPLEFFDEMDGVDLLEIQKIVMSFLPDGASATTGAQ